MSKFDEVVRILERRIRHGDYHGRDLPAERELAEEVGVSRMTARKALQHLVEQGLLEREVRRVRVSRRDVGKRFRAAFLVPTLVSQDVERWRMGIEHALGRFNATARTMLYVHWDDPTLQEALDGFDGVFLNPGSEPIPQRIVERLQRSGRRLVVLGRDLTALGIPSVDLFPSVAIQQLLDHLAQLGHKAIDCFNVQTVDPVIEERIKHWHLWRAAHRVPGRLLNESIRPYVESPLVHAYERFGQLLDEGTWKSTALLCTTAPAAIGAIRAMRDRGIRVGQDVSVCVVNDEGLGRFMSPSLTSIEMPDPEPYLAVCMEWMQQSPATGWVGSLLLRPSDVPIFFGESTGRAPVSSGAAARGEAE